jgi:hypothetical protein
MGVFGDRLGNLEHNPQDFLGLGVEGMRLAPLVVILPLVVIVPLVVIAPLVVIGARGSGQGSIHVSKSYL